MVVRTPGVESRYIWCDKDYRSIRIDQMPLAAFCLFKYLLPTYKVVVSASEHSPDGERFQKIRLNMLYLQTFMCTLKMKITSFFS
jgi:hypothetical protein